MKSYQRIVRTTCTLSRPWHLLLIFTVCCGALALFTVDARAATTIHVPDDFPTIQQAIDAAADEDTILVAPGTYDETINFNGKAITVRGLAGPEKTVINAKGAGSVVTCANGEANDSVLDGFTITGGNSQNGGGMLNEQSSPTVRNCAFTNNIANNRGGGMANIDSDPIVSDCVFENNSAGNGGGIGGDHASPTVTNCVFRANTATSFGGGMHNQFTNSAEITDCQFIANVASVDGGGMANLDGASPTVRNTQFLGNEAGEWGGGATNHNFTQPTYINCIFVGNSAEHGGAMTAVHDDAPQLIHCTLYGNTATDSGGGLWVFMWGGFLPDPPPVVGSIFWANQPDQIDDSIHVAEISFTNIQGGWPGENNFDVDPQLVNPAGPDGVLGTEDDNVRLQTDSPAIDAGDNDGVPDEIDTDLDGNPRIVDGDDDGNAIVDLGAFEFQPAIPGDLNDDNAVNITDLLALLDQWGDCDNPDDCPADVDNSGSVGVNDLLILLSNWG